jgi:hypothetical protein
MHIHPLLSMVGALCRYRLTLWLIPAAVYAVRRRREVSVLDVVMGGCSLLATLAMALPDTFFA